MRSGGGGLGGGVSSVIAGGNFWDGFRQGAITAGLNHAVHSSLLGSNVAAAAITGRLRHLFGPDARAYSGELTGLFGLGAKFEKGFLETLRGEHVGELTPYDDIGVGLGLPSLSVEGGVTNLYYSGSVSSITPAIFFGNYLQLNVGVDAGVSIGANAIYAPVKNSTHTVYGFGGSIGFGVSPVYGIDFNIFYRSSAPVNSNVRLPVQMGSGF